MPTTLISAYKKLINIAMLHSLNVVILVGLYNNTPKNLLFQEFFVYYYSIRAVETMGSFLTEKVNMQTENANGDKH
jgi:hypothetical protein